MTHTRRSTLLDCAQKHDLRFRLGLRPSSDSDALTFGRAWARVMEGDDPANTGLDLYQSAMLSAMAFRYRRAFDIVALEVPFIVERDGYSDGGVIDGIVRVGERLGLLERKTTRYFKDGLYWMRLEHDSQTATYFDGARSLGYDVQFVIYEVQEVPSLKPAKATPVELRKYTKAKKDEPSRLYANQRETDESPEEYGVRVAEWLDAQPRLHTREVGMPTAKLERALEDARQLAAVALQWPKWENPSACDRWSGCPYLQICHRTDLDTEVPLGFVREAAHQEVMERMDEPSEMETQ